MTAGDGAWAGWLDDHGAALLLYARQWASNQADAEDVVQEAFVRFWPARHQADDAVAYLYGCVRRQAMDFHRKRSRRQARENDRAATENFETEPLFHTDVENRERKSAIQAALSRLPDDQREVVVMKIWGGLTFAQIGRTLEISLNTAASRYRYAFRELRKELTEEFVP